MVSTPFKRKLYDKLLDWKQKYAGRYALLIEGARRVGKSTLAENFARMEYKSYILIDFSNCTQEVYDLFNDIADLDYVFMRLQTIYQVQLYRRESIVIFDEVQLQPKARQAIKHLVKDGRYDYLETGSLISIRRNVANILIPSEEMKMTLNPLDYEEFRWAVGDTVSMSILRDAYTPKLLMGAAHRSMMRNFRLYMLVGGMPQAVNTYLETKDLLEVDKIKREILDLYEADFHKIDSTGNLSKIFRSIPAQLTQNKRFKSYQVVDRHVSRMQLAEYYAELESSKTILIANHTNDPNVGFSLTADSDKFKLFLADTGLFVTLVFRDKDFVDNTLYAKLLSDKMNVNLGYVYENVVAQMLHANGHKLFFYTFPLEEGNGRYEIDFLINKHNKICPIEVKSANYRAHRSMDMFCEKFSQRVGEKYIIHTKDFAHDNDIRQLPTYATILL